MRWKSRLSPACPGGNAILSLTAEQPLACVCNTSPALRCSSCRSVALHTIMGQDRTYIDPEPHLIRLRLAKRDHRSHGQQKTKSFNKKLHGQINKELQSEKSGEKMPATTDKGHLDSIHSDLFDVRSLL